MLATLSCLSGSPKAVAPDAHTPAGSAWHKPEWASHTGYAPPPPMWLAEHAEGFSGELENALLICEATTTHRGDRQRLLADLRGHDTTRPDMDVWMTVGEHGVLTSGPTDSAWVRFGAPAVTLREGEGIGVALQDRGVFRKVTFDVMHASYSGELPLPLLSDESEGECLRVPDPWVQKVRDERLDEAAAQMHLYAAREVDLMQEDMGATSPHDPRDELQAAASVVGWGDEEIRLKVQKIARLDAAFRDQVGDAIVEVHPELPDQVEVDGTRYVAHPMECPRWFGYRSHGLWADCGIEVHVGMGERAHTIEIVDSTGAQAPAGVIIPLNDEEDRYRPLEPGEVGVLVVPIDEPEPPYALRVWGSEGPVWLAVPD